eukprot:6038641-Amphidinium_carterae.1
MSIMGGGWKRRFNIDCLCLSSSKLQVAHTLSPIRLSDCVHAIVRVFVPGSPDAAEFCRGHELYAIEAQVCYVLQSLSRSRKGPCLLSSCTRQEGSGQSKSSAVFFYGHKFQRESSHSGCCSIPLSSKASSAAGTKLPICNS